MCFLPVWHAFAFLPAHGQSQIRSLFSVNGMRFDFCLEGMHLCSPVHEHDKFDHCSALAARVMFFASMAYTCLGQQMNITNSI
mmetsp:Transcript_88262/g.161645  ORF Transcript_88262/g.161645 Transcript_88262/m.161645 type:complete len:83 (-) Transcript_88262:59-307(-)